MNKHSFIDDLINLYDQPVIRSLIQLIPCGVGSAFDVFVVYKIQEIRKERLRTFFDELGAGEIELTKNLIESEDFLYCYFATLRAALNARRREKTRMFARLLKSEVLPNSFSNTDEYEEYLKILDELSYREIEVLFILDEYETQFPKDPDVSNLSRIGNFWDNFTKDLSENLHIPHEEIYPLLTRLERSGCYVKLSGFTSSNTRGELTPTYYKLKRFIIREDGSFA